jgi:ribosomal protein S18 acetylase RimI-like enzyme
MQHLHQLARTILRSLQNLAVYRRLGRWAVSGLTLREATDADQMAVQRWFNPNNDPAQEAEHASNVTDWVADVNGQLAGFVELVRHPQEQALFQGHWLFSLSVKARWQGCGIGELLSRAVIERARAEGAPVLDLVVHEDNIRAIRLYNKLGFIRITLPKLEPQLESERASTGRRRVVMRRQLAPNI